MSTIVQLGWTAPENIAQLNAVEEARILVQRAFRLVYGLQLETGLYDAAQKALHAAHGYLLDREVVLRGLDPASAKGR